ncbi:MAG: tRNA pseudouridine(55) synthase TruB [Clostridia bacterium]|nr:tRNA pseudouridine(55) synthase TruB [Clostridia bacterium]
MDGVFIIDKEEGVSSHDVVAELRHIMGTKRIGHTGTLDPIATGALVICVNRATKLVQYLTCDDKTYEVEMKFGVKTDTGDRSGKIVKRGTSEIDTSKLGEVLGSFIGKQKQIPPMYSAVKVNGKKLYEYARKNQIIEREPRDIEIYDIYDAFYDEGILRYTIHCSKGTYIRTICEDIAERLGTYGTMMELRRTQIGDFTVDQAIKVADATEDKMISLEELIDKEVTIKKEKLFKLVNGMELYENKPDGVYKIYIDNYVKKKFIGVGILKNKYLKREIIL